MKFGYYVGEAVSMMIGGKSIAGRIKEIGQRFMVFASTGGKEYMIRVVGQAVSIAAL